MKKPHHATARIAALAAIAVLGATPIAANPQIVDQSFDDIETVQAKSDIGFSNGSFIVVPIPFSNPVIGSGLVLGGGYLFELDEGAGTSFIGFGALGSNNGSHAYGGAVNLSFGSGWGFDLAAAKADVQYDLFFGSGKLPIRQDGDLVNAGLDYNLTDTLSIGGALRYLDSQIRLNGADRRIPEDLLPDLRLKLVSLGGRAEWDTRDDGDYPTSGSRANLTANLGFSIDGAAREYGYTALNVDHYQPLRARTVLATRISTCAASSDTPFFDQCSLGFSDSFRGFSPTEFYDSRLISSQVEFRQRLGTRLGVVAFGGIGWTGPSLSDLDENGERVAGGFGLRYRLSRQFPIDFSADVSTNNSGAEYLYIYVGQRF